VGLLGTELENVEFLVGGNEINAGAMGVVGRNLLAWGDTEYDLAHGMVRLSFPKGYCEYANLAYWAGSAPVVVVPLDGQQHDGSEIRIPVAINGVRTLATMDTGATVTLDDDASGEARRDRRAIAGAGRPRRRIWRRAGEPLSRHRRPVRGRRGEGHQRRVRHRRRRLLQVDMLMGLDYFLSHRIYVSRLQHKVYITWNGGPVFVNSRVEPGDYDVRLAAVPKDLVGDDADALARRGDRRAGRRQSPAAPWPI
jgi:hypothetical protein